MWTCATKLSTCLDPQAKQEADARLVAELSQLRSQLSAAGGAAEASLRQQLDELRRKMEGDMDAMRKTHAQVRRVLNR